MTEKQKSQPKPRPIAQIKADYDRVCGLLGEKTYLMGYFRQEIIIMKKRLAQLHQESAAYEAEQALAQKPKDEPTQ